MPPTVTIEPPSMTRARARRGKSADALPSSRPKHCPVLPASCSPTCSIDIPILCCMFPPSQAAFVPPQALPHVCPRFARVKDDL